MSNNLILSKGFYFTEEISKLLALSIGYQGSLYVTNFILNRFSIKYRSLSYSTKQYVSTNLNKSLVMSYICYYFFKIIIKNPSYILNNTVNIPEKAQKNWKFLTIIYASTDLVSLLKNKNMPFSTKLHHYGVLLATGIILLSKFNGPSLAKALAVYGSFSSLAGIVNTYLGARKLFDPKTKFIKILKKIGLLSYIIACSGNWSWQLNYLTMYLKPPYRSDIILKFLLNTGLLYSWIQDDLKLMRHLITN